MRYKSMEVAAEWTQWITAIAIAIIVFRGAYVIFSMSTSLDDNYSFTAILHKVSNHIKALVILVSVEAIITLVKRYFFH